MKARIVIQMICAAAVLAVGCSKDDTQSEKAAVGKMDRLIAEHPATVADMERFVAGICDDVVRTGVWTSYRNGAVEATTLVNREDGQQTPKYALSPLNLLFFADGKCWQCYSPQTPPNLEYLYTELEWKADSDAKAIILTNRGLVAKGCKNGTTRLVLRYYGKNMYILDGMLPTPDDENAECMMRYFVRTDQEREQGRQWYTDHYTNDSAH